MAKKPFYKNWWFWVIIVIVGLAFSGSGTKTQPTQTTPQPSQPVVTKPVKPVEPVAVKTTSKEEAQKEFTRLMNLSKKSGLVKSYEMNENTSLKIFVSNIWYSQEVQFKKDMLAKFSSLEQSIYGRHRLEVRDAYSNEKLAEVTAFSGSVEVYK